MKKILLGASVIVAIAIGNVSARFVFGPIDPGDETITACAILAWITLYFIYEVAQRPIREAAAVRLAVRTECRAREAREVEEKAFIANYETLRKEFLEGRGALC